MAEAAAAAEAADAAETLELAAVTAVVVGKTSAELAVFTGLKIAEASEPPPSTLEPLM